MKNLKAFAVCLVLTFLFATASYAQPGRRAVPVMEDPSGNVTISRQELTPDLDVANTAAALAGGGAGNVDNGAHYYLVTFVTAQGETNVEGEDLGAVVVTVVDKTTDGQVALSAIPLGSSFVTARKVYRTKVGQDPNRITNYKLLATISNNTATTYTDNIADASLGAGTPPRVNGTANPWLKYTAASGQVDIGSVAIPLTGSASLDFGATAAGACDSLTITVTGAADGDPVALGIPNALAVADAYQSFHAFVSAANTVTVQRCNLTNATTALSNAAAATVKVTVLKP